MRFELITAPPMQRYAYHRYAVWDQGVGAPKFLGEVFAFRPSGESDTVRWLAQTPNGVVYGWLTHLHTRKAAGIALARARE